MNRPDWNFSDKSLEKLHTCDAALITLCREVLLVSPFDLTVLEGHRSQEQQEYYYRAGMSKIDGVNRKSKHQFNPSRAVDIAPYPVDWKDTRRFYMLGGLMLAVAESFNIRIRWGGDWDGDGEFTDQTFHDLPHFELRE